jgi:hypothetical protein
VTGIEPKSAQNGGYARVDRNEGTLRSVNASQGRE